MVPIAGFQPDHSLMAFAFLCAIRVFALAFAVTAAVSAASAQETERPRQFSRSHLRRQRTLRRRRARGAAGRPGGARSTARRRAPTSCCGSIASKAQIRQLTGAIEQLQFRNQQLEQHVRRMQEDAEYRFQELGSKGAARPAPTRPQAAPSPAASRRHRRAGHGAAMPSIPRSIRTRPACRERSARSPARRSTGRAAGASTRTIASIRRITERPAPPRSRARRRRSGRDPAAVADAEGRIRPRLRLCAAQGLCAGRGRLSHLPEEISERPDGRATPPFGSARACSSASASATRPRPSSTSRPSSRPMPGRPTRCSASGSRSPRSARRRRPARRSARSRASFPAHRRA